MFRRVSRMWTILAVGLAGVGFGLAAEGMWPMSEVGRLDLRDRGLRIDPAQIYNPEGISLVDGICKIECCTGSFVSPERVDPDQPPLRLRGRPGGEHEGTQPPGGRFPGQGPDR